MACPLVPIGTRVRQPDSDRKSLMRTGHCVFYPRVVTPILLLLVSWYTLLPQSARAAHKADPKLPPPTIEQIRCAVKSTMAQQQVVGVAVGVNPRGTCRLPGRVRLRRSRKTDSSDLPDTVPLGLHLQNTDGGGHLAVVGEKEAETQRRRPAAMCPNFLTKVCRFRFVTCSATRVELCITVTVG